MQRQGRVEEKTDLTIVLGRLVPGKVKPVAGKANRPTAKAVETE